MNIPQLSLALFALLTTSFLLGTPSTAAAQDLSQLELTAEQSQELGEIQTERHWSIGLYVGATTLAIGGGVGTLLSGIFTTVGDINSGISWMLGSVITAGVGVLMFIPAIALDVSSHLRRNHLRSDVVGLSVSVRPVLGGASLGAELTF